MECVATTNLGCNLFGPTSGVDEDRAIKPSSTLLVEDKFLPRGVRGCGPEPFWDVLVVSAEDTEDPLGDLVLVREKHAIGAKSGCRRPVVHCAKKRGRSYLPRLEDDDSHRLLVVIRPGYAVVDSPLALIPPVEGLKVLILVPDLDEGVDVERRTDLAQSDHRMHAVIWVFCLNGSLIQVSLLLRDDVFGEINLGFWKGSEYRALLYIVSSGQASTGAASASSGSTGTSTAAWAAASGSTISSRALASLKAPRT